MFGEPQPAFTDFRLTPNSCSLHKANRARESIGAQKDVSFDSLICAIHVYRKAKTGHRRPRQLHTHQLRFRTPFAVVGEQDKVGGDFFRLIAWWG